MDHRTLGRTGLHVSTISLGMEHLDMNDPAVTVAAIGAALDSGVNYFDLLLGPSHACGEVLAEAFAECPHTVMFAAHLGCGQKNGKYRRTREVAECEDIFGATLDMLPNHRVDVLFACHNVDEHDDYEHIMTSGVFDLAMKLQAAGKARHLGFSGHTASTALEALQTGAFDVLMYPISFKTDNEPRRNDLLHYCAARAIGVVGMKTFAGGALFEHEIAMTPVPCISYSLTRPGVATAAVGVKTPEQMHAALAYLAADERQRDFHEILAGLRGDEHADGQCVYCNHCLPCPADIDIPQVLRLARSARDGATDELRRRYAAGKPRADACTRCGTCEPRCPFGVKTIAELAEAHNLLGGAD